ncbi:cysteine hydrolase family protein [Erysipelothrix anatis]|uniref:cysteine hydrolase family protein n=1 Tax=Erysipelothrix anatis TaxID=2683713 RepID=UPI001358184A|nr:isochorismatase family cysteine hydrolase [Erysipelothrix anatis]
MKKLYMIVDVQNDFVDGALGFEKADDVVKQIVETLETKLEPEDVVVFTRDTHYENYLETQEGKRLPIPHCIHGTYGWEIVEALSPWIKTSTQIFDKPTFGSLELGNYLKTQDFDEIEIMGLVSNICVITNAAIAKAALPEARIVVNRNLTSSFDESLDLKALEVMAGFQIDIVGTEA